MDFLSNEMVTEILIWLNHGDLLQVRLVTSKFRDLIDGYIWEQKLQLEFPDRSIYTRYLREQNAMISYVIVSTLSGQVVRGSENIRDLIYCARRSLRQGDLDLHNYFFNRYLDFYELSPDTADRIERIYFESYLGGLEGGLESAIKLYEDKFNLNHTRALKIAKIAAGTGREDLMLRMIRVLNPDADENQHLDRLNLRKALTYAIRNQQTSLIEKYRDELEINRVNFRYEMETCSCLEQSHFKNLDGIDYGIYGAALSGNCNLLEDVIRYGEVENPKWAKISIAAARRGRIELLSRSLSKLESLDPKDENRLVHYSIKTGNPVVIEMVTRRIASITIKPRYYFQLLIFNAASYFGISALKIPEILFIGTSVWCNIAFVRLQERYDYYALILDLIKRSKSIEVTNYSKALIESIRSPENLKFFQSLEKRPRLNWDFCSLFQEEALD